MDPIAALAPRDDERVSWLVPGRVQLELGGAPAGGGALGRIGGPIDAPGGDRPIEVVVIEPGAADAGAGRRRGRGGDGGAVRVAVRLPHARFAVWAERGQLMGIVQRTQRISDGVPPPGELFVELRAGARVRRLAHRDGRTQVRHVGALEVEGWIPDDALGDAWPRGDRAGRIMSGYRTLLVSPGAVIRAEPRWTATALATVADGHFVDAVRELNPAWVEVAYADGEVAVRGYLSRRDPPGRVHRPRDPEVPPPAAAPNARAASGTCLYARPGGDAIGYLVGDQDVELEEGRGGFWALAIDTPWGAIAFAARGSGPADLVACAPTGSVPPPAGAGQPTPPAPPAIGP